MLPFGCNMGGLAVDLTVHVWLSRLRLSSSVCVLAVTAMKAAHSALQISLQYLFQYLTSADISWGSAAQCLAVVALGGGLKAVVQVLRRVLAALLFVCLLDDGCTSRSDYQSSDAALHDHREYIWGSRWAPIILHHVFAFFASGAYA